MTFKSIYARTYRPNEVITLLHREATANLDEIGFAQEEWIDVQALHGVIQLSQVTDISEKGVESNPVYTGYFLPEFDINANQLDNYRIRYQKPHETILLKIDDYDPNLYLRHSQDHIQMTLRLEKKI